MRTQSKCESSSSANVEENLRSSTRANLPRGCGGGTLKYFLTGLWSDATLPSGSDDEDSFHNSRSRIPASAHVVRHRWIPTESNRRRHFDACHFDEHHFDG